MKQRLLVALLAALASVAAALPAALARAQVETIVASDDFNRADELPFATTGNWGRTIAGNYDGFSNLTGNHVTAGTQEGIYYWKGPGTFSNTSQFARHHVLDSTGEPGIVLLGGADHAILLNWGPPGPGVDKSVFIYWYANGQDQGLLEVETSPLADGDVLEGVLDGGIIYAKVNGVTVASVPNTTTIASGTPGFITYLNPALPTLVAGLDDWEAGTPVSFSISGTVTEDGLGRSGVLVTASGGFGGSATTDVDGNYTIVGVPVNATGITLTPTLADHTMSPVTRTVAGPVTGPVTGQDFVSTPIVSFPISGTVTEGGLGAAGVLVTASGGFAGSATTDANGEYTIDGVPQNATAITLTPTLAGRTFTPVTRTIAGPVTADVTGQDFIGTPIPMTLTIFAANGTVTRDPDLPTYPAGTVVTLTAIPDVDYVFGGWTGDVPPGQQAANPLQVTMSQDRTITAAFGAANVIAADNFNRADELPFATTGNWGRTIAGNFDGFSNLTGNHVTAGTQEGIYYWKGPGTFSNTSQFARHHVLDATGEPGIVLLGGPDHAILLNWGPPGPGANKSVFIYWYANGQDQGVLNVTASPLADGDVLEGVLDGGFIHAKVNGVTVASVPNTTTIASGTPGFITYLNPALPTLVAGLDDWEAGTPVSVAISGTVTEGGLGKSGVLVTASGGFGGSATTDVDGNYTIVGVPVNAPTITLTPTLVGHTFAPVTLTVTGPVTADVTGQDFTSTPITEATLTILTNHGTVTRDPDLSPYPIGTVVTLTATPDPGYAFAGWSGDIPPGQGGANPLVVTMDQDRTITATFGSADVIASDDFNRPNETPLFVGGNWQQSFGTGTAHLVGDQVVGVTNDALYYWSGAGIFDVANQYARARVADAGGQVGLVLLGGVGQGIVASWDDGVLFVYWYSGGSYRGNLATLPSTIQADDLIEAELSNGAVAAKINGTVVLSVQNTTTLTTGTPGFETFQTGGALDDWEAGTPFSFAISGTILENGAGLANVLVNASGGFTGTAVTRNTGAYTLTGVPSSAEGILLTPTLSGHAMSPLTRTVDGPVNVNVTGQDFTSTSTLAAVLTTLGSHGTVQRSPDAPSYPLMTEVTLTPVPDPGYAFAGWSGSVPPGHELDDPLVITMDQNKTITALFLQPGVTSAEYFDRANETPVAVGGNWGKSLAGNANLVANQVVGATGEAIYFWQGSGAFDDTAQYSRARVTSAAGQVGLVLLGGVGQALVASWDEGVLYVYWYSASTYQGNLVTLPAVIQDGDLIEAELSNGAIAAKINGNVVVSIPNTTSLTSGRPGFELFETGGALDDWEAGTPASFAISGTILENGVGLGGAHVNASGGFAGTAVTTAAGVYILTAVPENATSTLLTPTLAGYAFTPLTRTVDGPVVANVTGEDFTAVLAEGLVLTTFGSHGTVLRSPDEPTYSLNTPVTLTPVPDSGYVFAGWSGSVPPGQANDNPLVVTMDQHRTITALFLHPGASAGEYFDRANELPLVVGGNWGQSLGGVANLIGNQLQGGSGEAVYFWQGPGAFDDSRQVARAVVTSDSGQIGLVLLGGPGQGLIVSWHNDTLFFYWYSSGIYRGNLWVQPSQIEPGDVIEAELANGKVKAKINGVTVAQVDNTTTLTSGRPGIQLFQSGGSLDDWEAGISTTPPIAVFPYLD